MNIEMSVTDAIAAANALNYQAADFRLAARGRTFAGPEHADMRRTVRDQATRLDEIAANLRASIHAVAGS